MSSDNSIIYGYFRLPNKIKRVNDRLQCVKSYFWQQSFTSCPNAYDDNGNKVGMVPFQIQVNDLVDFESFNNSISNMLEFKLKEFNNYISSLNAEDGRSLVNKFSLRVSSLVSEELEDKTINECNQIEEASGYRYGFKNDEAVEITNDYNSNLNRILSVLS